MNKYFPVVALVCLFLFSSCDSAGNEDAPVLFPTVQVGDAWIMTRTDSLGSGYPLSMMNINVTSDTFSVEEMQEIDGSTWFRIENREETSFAAPLLGMQRLFSFREDGLWRLSNENEPLRIITFPTESTQEYSIQEGVSFRFVESDFIYDSAVFGEIPVTRFQHRYTTGFRPLAGDSTWGDYGLEADRITETLYSAELGIVRLENFYVSPAGGDGFMHVVGSITWELEKYLPASGQ